VPLPPLVNEDELSFTKFEITNTNCDDKLVTFFDTLSAGPKWNLKLLTLDNANIVSSTSIDTLQSLDNRHVLTIVDLNVPDNGQPSFIAPAILLSDAVTELEVFKIFYNHANIDYCTGTQLLYYWRRYHTTPQHPLV
jgi:hypothetical protein